MIVICWDLGPGEKRGIENQAPVLRRKLSLPCGHYCSGPLKICFWSRSRGLETSASTDSWGIDPSSDCLYKWGKVPGWPTSLKILPLEMAFPLTKKARPWVRLCSLRRFLDGSQKFFMIFAIASFLLYILALLHTVPDHGYKTPHTAAAWNKPFSGLPGSVASFWSF